MLEETISNVESAQADVNVFAALKTGDKVLKDLHEKVKMEDWDELYESHADSKARMDMEVEMFGEALNDDALADELDGLVADDVAG